MNRSKDIITYNTLIQYDSILIVVTLPRHVSHEEVTAKSQLTVFGSITLSKDVTLLHNLTCIANRTEVNGHILVRTAELGNLVFLYVRIEANKLFIFRTVVSNTDGSSIYIFNHTITFCRNHRT